MTTTLDALHIQVSGDEAYEKDIIRILNRILLTNTGNAIATKIRTHGLLQIKQKDDRTDPQATTQRWRGR